MSFGDNFRKSPTLENGIPSAERSPPRTFRDHQESEDSDREDEEDDELQRHPRRRMQNQRPSVHPTRPRADSKRRAIHRIVPAEDDFQDSDLDTSASDDLEELKQPTTKKKPTPAAVPTPTKDLDDLELYSNSDDDDNEKAQPEQQRRENIRKFLRPSPTEQKLRAIPIPIPIPQQPLLTPTFTPVVQRPSTPIPPPKRPVRALPPNIQRLEQALLEISEEKNKIQLGSDEKKHSPSGESAMVDDIAAKPYGKTVLMLSPNCSETRYIFRTVTDNGSKWGSETKAKNPNQSRLYYILTDFDPDGPIPEWHNPIVLSGDCYATITVDLSWFPICNGPGSEGILPADALRGVTQLRFLCFPNVMQKQKAIYTCEIVPQSNITVEARNAKKSMALIDKQVAFQVQVFSNAKEVLLPFPSLTEVDAEVQSIAFVKSKGPTLWYLDMHVSHLKQDILRYRLYWTAAVSVTMSSLHTKL